MSKTGKNLLIAFTLVCMIVLIIFTVELLILNKDNNGDSNGISNGGSNGGSENESSMSESVPSEADNSADISLLSPSDNEPSSEITDNQPSDSALPNAGTRYSLMITSSDLPNNLLVWYVDEELFECTDNDPDQVFSYLGEGTASLEIRVVYIPQGAETYAESYLNRYLDGNESYVSGIGQIRQSLIDGVFVSGVNDGETFEAWIHSIPDDPNYMGVAFVIRYSNNDQRNALYTILDTLDLETETSNPQ